MIPKIIHYCWYGNGEKPDNFYVCYASWKKFFPDYEIKEWNESNSDIENAIPYVQEAYAAKKYAFVSDYFRLKALYEYGGIYFDTDYEVLKPMNSLLSEGSLITGFEGKESLLTAIIAVEKNNPIIGKFLQNYETRHFSNEDGQYDLTPINEHFNQLMAEEGIDLSDNVFQETSSGIRIYPLENLCSFDMKNWHEKITAQSYGVHHMGSSWITPKWEKHFALIAFMQKLLGEKTYDFLKENIYDRMKKKK